METHSTVQLFLRFRAHGDLDALARVFDACAPKLLGVARHLVRDEALAEDAVQQTFVTAIEDAQRFDATRDLEAWLVGILTHKARDLAARDARRPDPARLDAARSADPASEVELADFVATLERALERVPVAYREVLRKNLADGRTPQEIAQDLARDPNTVRVQLHRGMEHLRRVLPAGFALGAAVIASSPRGLAALRAEVLEHASATAHTANSATASTTSHAAPSSTLAKSLSLAGAAALVLMSAAFLAFGGKPAPIESADIQAASATSPSSTSASVELEPSPPVPQPHAPLAVQAPTTGALDIEVVWHDGTPAVDVEVCVRPRAWATAFFDGASYARTGADGHARFDALAPRDARACVEYAFASTPVQIAAGETHTARVTVARHVDVAGHVTRPDGTAAAGASVWCGDDDLSGVRGRIVTLADANGAFAVRSCPRQSALFATAEGLATTSAVELRTLAGESGSIDLAFTSPGAVLELAVRDTAGVPLADAWGLLAPARGSSGRAAALRFRTDASGRARLATLAGQVTLTVSATGQPCTEVQLALPSGTTTRELALAPAVWVRGCARDASGAPRGDVAVELDISQRISGEAEWMRVALTDAAGTYRAGPFAAGRFALVARTRDGDRGPREARAFDVPAAGEITWDFSLGTVHTIRGRVVDGQGTPLAGCEVGALTKPPLADPSGPARTDALGRFEVRGLVGGAPHEVYVRAPRAYGDVVTTRDDVLPDGDDVELQLAVDRPAGAFLVGRVTQAGVGGLVGAEVSLRGATGGAYRAKITTTDGAFELGPLPSGTYTARILGAGTLLRVLTGVTVAGDERKDLGEVALPGFGGAKLRLHGAEGVQLDGLLLFAVDDQHENHKLNSAGGGVYEDAQLLAGRYTLRTFGGRTRVPERAFDIVAGETAELALDCAPATFSVIVFTVPEGSPAPAHVRIEARQGGVLVASHDGQPNMSGGKHVASLVTPLPSGAYTCDANVDGVWTGHATFTIAPPYEPDLFRLEVPLVHR